MSERRRYSTDELKVMTKAEITAYRDSLRSSPDPDDKEIVFYLTEYLGILEIFAKLRFKTSFYAAIENMLQHEYPDLYKIWEQEKIFDERGTQIDYRFNGDSWDRKSALFEEETWDRWREANTAFHDAMKTIVKKISDEALKRIDY
jgi:hypothetical protein